MSKRKILTLALSLCMIAILAVGGTLAYFADTESATNVFTLGNVKIDLVEEQRDGEGFLEEFEDDKVLLPIVGSAQGEKETVGGYNLPKAKNWVDKIVTVDNEGTQPAYVRVLMAFPAKMDADKATNMIMHWNCDGKEPDGYWTREGGNVKITIDGEEYNIYTMTYEKVLAKKGENGATTEWPAILGVYIDERVNATADAQGNITYSMAISEDETVSATYAAGTGPKLLVIAQGVQSEGFDSAKEALTAGFGVVDATNAAEWFGAAKANTDAVTDAEGNVTTPAGTDDRADIK